MKKVLYALLAVIVVGGLVIAYLWFKPHRDIQGEEAAYNMEAPELMIAFSENEEEANKQYLDQVVAVKGDALEIAADHIILEGGVYCSGDFSANTLQEGDEVVLKGRVVSYDNLFKEVKMDHCTLAD